MYKSLRDTTHSGGLRSARGRGARGDERRGLTSNSAFMMEILEVFRVVNCRLPAQQKIVDKLLVKNVKKVIYVKKKLYLCNVKTNGSITKNKTTMRTTNEPTVKFKIGDETLCTFNSTIDAAEWYVVLGQEQGAEPYDILRPGMYKSCIEAMKIKYNKQ